MTDTLKVHIRVQSRNNFVINLLLNGVLAWVLLKDKGALSAWGDPGFGADLVITGFLLAALVAIFMIRIHRAKRVQGRLEPVPVDALGAVAPLAGRNDWINSLLFGLAGALLSAALVGVLALMPLLPLSPVVYAVFKGVWAGVLAALVVPPAIRLGLYASVTGST